jgi:hypothetical protein
MHGVFRCVSVTNVNTGSEFTMTSRVLNLTGSATLGTLGHTVVARAGILVITWRSQPDCRGARTGNWDLGRQHTQGPFIGLSLQCNTDLELQFSGWSSTFLNNSQWIITDLYPFPVLRLSAA